MQKTKSHNSKALELQNMPQTLEIITYLTSYIFQRPKSKKLKLTGFKNTSKIEDHHTFDVLHLPKTKPTTIKLLGYKMCIKKWTKAHFWPPKSNLKNQTIKNEKVGNLPCRWSLWSKAPTICVSRGRREGWRITTIKGGR